MFWNKESAILFSDSIENIFIIAVGTVLVGLYINTVVHSNISMSLRNTFLHFLQANTIYVVFFKGWSINSLWQSEQSNHLSQHLDLIAAWTFKICLHINLCFQLYSNLINKIINTPDHQLTPPIQPITTNNAISQ